MHQLTHPAYRWRNGELTRIVLPESVNSVHLIGLDEQIKLVDGNIRYFLEGNPALNVLLWGEKGGGKSTVVRLLARDYADKGLRIIEFCDNDFYNIYGLYSLIRSHDNLFFVIYFDDVSFDNDDERYRNFKSIVEGGLEERPKNAIFIATSNRRHLIAEQAQDTEDLYSRDANNEQSSLYARFGLAVGFYPLGRELYLKIVSHYFGGDKFDGWQEAAENFAIERGGRSGRVAQQFVIYKKIVGDK